MVIGTISGPLDLASTFGALLAQAPWAAPRRLPPPPELQHYILERPVLAAVVLSAFALIALFGGRAQGRPRAGAMVAGLFALVAVAVLVLGTLVTTDRERLVIATRALLDAVRAGDTAGAGRLLDERLAINAGGGSAGLDRAWVLAAIDLFPEQLEVQGARVEQRRASIDSPGIGRSQLQVRGGPTGGGPNLTWWEFSWRRTDDGAWRIQEIELLLVNGQPPDRALSEAIRSRP